MRLCLLQINRLIFIDIFLGMIYHNGIGDDDYAKYKTNFRFEKLYRST